MKKNYKNFRGNVLIELIIKGYTEDFLNVFLVFFKQRFFKNFVKLGSNTTIFNKYTLLRSSFVNKSSREQIEKRIYKKKINLVFSEFDFKFFYSNLNSLNFKGISLKLLKYYFFDNSKVNTISKTLYSLKGFNSLWKFLSKDKKKNLLNLSEDKALHKVFPTIGLKKPFSKFSSLKFLKLKSFRKNRLKHGLFKVLKKKPTYRERIFFTRSFSNTLFNKRKTTSILFKKGIKSFIKFKPAIVALSYSFSFNNIGNSQKPNNFENNLFFNFFSNKEKNHLLKKKYLLNSVLRSRISFINPFFINNRKVNGYRGGLSRTNLIGKLNIFNKLIQSLKIGPFIFKFNMLFKNNFEFILNQEKHFYLFISLLQKNKTKELNKIFYKKNLLISSKLENSDKSSFFKLYSKVKQNDNFVTINPWLVRRFILQNFKGENLTKFLALYQKYSIIKSLNNSLYFRSKDIFFFLMWYSANILTSSGKKKFHLKKRRKYFLTRNWGLVWRFKSKKRFFFKIRRKKNSWKRFNRNFKNTYQKKKLKRINIRKKNYKKSYKTSKKGHVLKKPFLNIFSI